MKISIIVAISLDYRITDINGSTSWTSKEDQDHLKYLIKQSDILIMGRKTYDVFKDKIQLSYSKQRIVLSREIKHSLDFKSLKFTRQKPQEIIESLDSQKNVLILGGNQIYDLFLRDDLVDNIYLTIEPVKLNTGLQITSMLINPAGFKLKNTKTINKQGTVIKHYEKKD